MKMVHHNFLLTTSTFITFIMAGVTGSKTFGISVLMLSMLILFATHVHAHEDRAAVEAKDSLPESSQGKRVKYGSMSFFEDHEGSESEHPTCTCTCYPGDAPKTPRTSKPPTSQNSPIGRKKSPPPPPYYSPSPVYNSPSPPPGSTQSPVTFDHSPPPPAPYSDAPTNEPSPVVAAPETFQPPPPIY